MAEPKIYRWKGPPTAVELWPIPKEGEAKAAEPLLSRMVASGGALPPLDPDHPVVKGWAAFGLIEPVPAPVKTARPRATE